MRGRGSEERGSYKQRVDGGEVLLDAQGRDEVTPGEGVEKDVAQATGVIHLVGQRESGHRRGGGGYEEHNMHR